jgi:hypothetical protein
MSVENPQSQVARSHSQAQSNCPPSETINQLSTHDSKSSTDSIYLVQVNDAALAAAYQDEFASPTSPGRLEKENSPHDGAPAVEESLEVKLEQLGRQRPEVFGSMWAEIGFVFSISMSQVLSVILSFNFIDPALTSSRNISCLALLSSFQHWSRIWISLLRRRHGLRVPSR